MNNDQLSSLSFAVIGLAICLASIPYKLGPLSQPDSGFMPFATGAAIVLISGVGFVNGSLQRRKGEKWASPLKGVRWKKAVLVLVVLIGYVLLLQTLGFLLCTFLFIGILMRVMVPYRWPIVVGSAFLTSLLSYSIFEIWLKAQLPRGLWGM